MFKKSNDLCEKGICIVFDHLRVNMYPIKSEEIIYWIYNLIHAVF